MFRTKKALVRVLDSPLQLTIKPEVILVPLTDGKVLVITGNFENITDEAAYRLAADTADKFKVA